MTRSIIITGSSGGIGLALVKAFKDNGWFVLGIDKAENKELNSQYLCNKFFSFDLALCKEREIFKSLIEQIKDEIKRLGLTISTKNISQAVINIRERKLPNPNKIGNCGSFFKNPTISRKRFEDLKKLFPGIIGYNVSSQRIKIAAAWLIQECGWKGYRNKDVGVHKNQALVLVNYGEGKGEEIAFLAKEIQASVKKKFDISLDREVNII